MSTALAAAAGGRLPIAEVVDGRFSRATFYEADLHAFSQEYLSDLGLRQPSEMGIDEVALAVGVRRTAIYHACQLGLLKAQRSGKAYIFQRGDVRQFVAEWTVLSRLAALHQVSLLDLRLWKGFKACASIGISSIKKQNNTFRFYRLDDLRCVGLADEISRLGGVSHVGDELLA